MLEAFDLGHRLNVTRFFYHWSIGAFSIRDPNDKIEILDDLIENIPIRIYRSDKKASESDLNPTIIFYHGGGHFLGTAGTFF